ncbi:MAG: hypothetical protein OHK0046_44500 [Anaerolineae bacterium]
MRSETAEAILRRRTLVRTILFLVILGTLPFYLLGFILWGTAQDPNAPEATNTPPATNTITGLDATATNPLVTSTPRPTETQAEPLPPTSPPFTIPTRFLSATPTLFIPTSTTAPTLTPPVPTDTPTPTPTNTDVPPQPTEIPTLPLLEPPTDTPAP